jgi:hypothetical protein
MTTPDGAQTVPMDSWMREGLRPRNMVVDGAIELAMEIFIAWDYLVSTSTFHRKLAVGILAYCGKNRGI